MNNLYKDDSIQSISARDFTRLRSGVYCGSTEYSTQLLVEIVSNAIDEYSVGHGNIINVDYKDDGSCRVEDFGQGFPVNVVREDGETILQASFDVINTSGKFAEDGVYEGTALGLNGIGSKLTNFLSKYLDVFTFRDGKSEHIHFKDGLFESRRVDKQRDFHTGTIVEWQPDPQFFTNPQIDINRIKKLFHEWSCLCPGLVINLTHNGKELITFKSKHGLNDLVSDITKNKELIKNRLNISYQNGKNKLDLVLSYANNYSFSMTAYVNVGETDAGPHITQIKSIITREFNKFFREKKWIKDKDENLTGDDLQEGLVIAFNITTSGVSYDAQTKGRVVKLDMTPFTTVITNSIQAWLSANEKEIKIIADKALAARKAREAAKKARDNAREGKQKKEKALKFDSKLADCWSRDRSKCEVMVVEGDSASGNLKSGRNAEFQAVMPVRGKILNVHKASLDKIQKNAEIMTMINAFGLSLDLKNMRVSYNPDDLRYGKIIILSDADCDGSHIKNLFYTFIWNFCPQLILDGYVYASVPPLYKITMGKDTYIYLKNDRELEAFRTQNKGKKYLVSRFKGLGEMSPEETAQTLLDPETRILKQITVDDIDKTNNLFDTLMGTEVVGRKQFIKDHSQEAKFSV